MKLGHIGEKLLLKGLERKLNDIRDLRDRTCSSTTKSPVGYLSVTFQFHNA